MTDHQLFVSLSCALTGMAEEELPVTAMEQDAVGMAVKLYELYFERLRAAYPAELSELMTLWRSIQKDADPEASLQQRLVAAGTPGERLRMAARQIIKIWMLSTIDDPRVPLDPKKKGKSGKQLGGDVGQYQLAAVYKLIGAPAPGYSDFQHGYWAEKPVVPPLPK